jgi:hypothetical protein
MLYPSVYRSLNGLKATGNAYQSLQPILRSLATTPRIAYVEHLKTKIFTSTLKKRYSLGTTTLAL